MKRYVTGYSKGVFTVRDRLTNQSKRMINVDKDLADILSTAIAQANYNIPERKPKVKTLTIAECSDWFKSVDTQFKSDFGWLQPKELKWETEKVVSKETINKLKDLTQQLDELLSDM